jgi:hypothetical protein
MVPRHWHNLWVGDRPLSRNKRLNNEADKLADIIQLEVNGSAVVKTERAHWALETLSLRSNGSKITSNMKQKLKAQLHDGDLLDCLLEREDTFNNISWEACDTAFLRLSINRCITISKVCYNLWYTGVRNQLYYQEVRPCCMCRNKVEDWWHVITCPSLDAALNRASRRKVKKSMGRWKLQNDFWIAVGKGMLSYNGNQAKAKYRPSPATPFHSTFNNQRN